MVISYQVFEPHSLFRGGMVQTILGSQFPGAPELPRRLCHRLQVGPNSVLLLYELESQKAGLPMVLLAHGMGGCSESGYMKRVAGKLWSKGYPVFLMNHRGSGPGMGMSDSLWNGGSSGDLARVIEYIAAKYQQQSLLVIGFSLSGNILLKYLGEGNKIPSNVVGAFAVNPPIDLKVASHLLSHGRETMLFNRYYMKMIQCQAEAVTECFPTAFQPPLNLTNIWDFDAAYTAPVSGFQDVEEYYQKCSANQFLDNIKVPTTILCSKDDPFIPPEVFQDVRMSLVVNYCAPDGGGHMGYIAKRTTPLGDRRWMDYVILDWAQNFSR